MMMVVIQLVVLTLNKIKKLLDNILWWLTGNRYIKPKHTPKI